MGRPDPVPSSYPTHLTPKPLLLNCTTGYFAELGPFIFAGLYAFALLMWTLGGGRRWCCFCFELM